MPYGIDSSVSLGAKQKQESPTAVRTLSQRIIVTYICDSTLTPNLFYREVLLHFSIQPAFKSTDMNRQFHILMLDFYENEKKIQIVVLDEAHHFSETMLRELGFILNFKEDSMSRLALIIVGQPSLRNALRAKQLEAIDQRIQMRFQMRRLRLYTTSATETQEKSTYYYVAKG